MQYYKTYYFVICSFPATRHSQKVPIIKVHINTKTNMLQY